MIRGLLLINLFVPFLRIFRNEIRYFFLPEHSMFPIVFLLSSNVHHFLIVFPAFVYMCFSLPFIIGCAFCQGDRLPSLRAPAYSNHLPGAGYDSMMCVHMYMYTLSIFIFAHSCKCSHTYIHTYMHTCIHKMT